MTPKGLELIIQVLNELAAYPEGPMIEAIVIQFRTLIPTLPQSQKNTLNLALLPFNQKNSEADTSTQETKVTPVEKLRSTLTEIINAETTSTSDLRYDKKLYDAIFKMQIALAWAFPVNNVEDNGKYSDHISGDEFTLNDPGLAAASDGVIYLIEPLTNYFLTNSAYDHESFAAKLPNTDPYRPRISEREKASLHAQGVNFPELTPEVRERIQDQHAMGLGGQRIDEDIHFDQQQYLGPIEDTFTFIHLARNPAQSVGLIIGSFIGLLVINALIIFFFVNFALIIASFMSPSFLATAFVCGVIELFKGNDPAASIMDVISSYSLIGVICGLIAVGLAAYFSIPTFVLLNLIVSYQNLIDLFPLLLLGIGVISAMMGGSIMDPFTWIKSTYNKCILVLAQATFGLCGLGLVKLYQNICQCFTAAEVQEGLPVVDVAAITPEPLAAAPNTAGIQRRLQRSQSMPDLLSIPSSTSEIVTDAPEQKISIASAFSTKLRRSRSMTLLDANIGTVTRNHPSTMPTHEQEAPLNCKISSL